MTAPANPMEPSGSSAEGGEPTRQQAGSRASSPGLASWFTAGNSGTRAMQRGGGVSVPVRVPDVPQRQVVGFVPRAASRQPSQDGPQADDGPAVPLLHVQTSTDLHEGEGFVTSNLASMASLPYPANPSIPAEPGDVSASLSLGTSARTPVASDFDGHAAAPFAQPDHSGPLSSKHGALDVTQPWLHHAQSARSTTSDAAQLRQSGVSGPAAGNGGEVSAGGAQLAAAAASKPAGVAALVNDAFIGVVNWVVAMPVTIAFASILYNDEVYRPYLPLLARLLLATNAVQQFSESCFSSLPFGIGQVQDLGLIFLSTMTMRIANALEGEPVEKMLGTAIITSAISTAILGLGLFVAGKFRMASVVSYIPLPVVAGYLAYVGYYCIAAGLGQATNFTINSIPTWAQLADPACWDKLAVALASCILLTVTLRVWRSPAALPGVLLLIPSMWYVVLGVYCLWTGKSWARLQDTLADNGWVSQSPGASELVPGWEVYKLFNLFPFKPENIAWGVIAQQAPTMAALCIVCIFGVSMDLMAVQAQLPYEFDADKEIVTVGINNLFSGLLAGGGTGSVIFSQCVLAIRANVTTRLQGFTLSLLQFLCFILPISVTHYLPNFFYGSLLVAIGGDILYEWLFATYPRVKPAEFILAWLGFILTLVLTATLPVQGLELSMLVGVLLCSLHFAWEYSVMQLVTFAVAPSRSYDLLPARYQKILSLFDNHMIAVSVSGYIFFGSMVEISRRVRDTVRTRSIPPAASLLAEAGFDTDQEPGLLEHATAALATAKRFLLLDLRSVTGIDATAANSFAMLRRTLQTQGVIMVLTGVGGTGGVHRLLVANGLVGGADWEKEASCPAFGELDSALAWCENHFIKVATSKHLLEDLSAQQLTLEEVLRMNPSGICMVDNGSGTRDAAALATAMKAYMQPRPVAAYTHLWAQGEPGDSIFILLSGCLQLLADFGLMSGTAESTSLEWSAVFAPEQGTHANPEARSLVPMQHFLSPRPVDLRGGGGIVPRVHRTRVIQVGPGTLVGSLDFTLCRSRTLQCVALKDSHVLELSRAQFLRMSRDDPELTSVLQQIMLRSSMLTTAHALHALEQAVVR